MDFLREFQYRNTPLNKHTKGTLKWVYLILSVTLVRKVFSKEEEASKAVTQHIAEDNPGVENLSVTVENGVANIQGVASTAAALEKAVLMAGNIQGIHSVTSDASINNGETLGSDETFYVIQKGDTLWKIAEKAYGNGCEIHRYR